MHTQTHTPVHHLALFIAPDYCWVLVAVLMAATALGRLDVPCEFIGRGFLVKSRWPSLACARSELFNAHPGVLCHLLLAPTR